MILPNLKQGLSSISGCVLCLAWFPSSTTIDGSNNVSQVNDISGQGNNFAQATSANRPAYVSTEPYGVSNNASAKEVTSSTTYALSAQTYCIKFKLDATPGSNVQMNLLNLRSATGPLFTEICCLNFSGFQPYSWCSNYVSSTAYRGANVALDTNTHRLIMTYNGSGNTTNANYQFFLDGASKTVVADTGAGAQTAGNLSSVGARHQSGGAIVPINGKVYAVAVYNRVLSAAEITAADQMMQAL